MNSFSWGGVLSNSGVNIIFNFGEISCYEIFSLSWGNPKVISENLRQLVEVQTCWVKTISTPVDWVVHRSKMAILFSRLLVAQMRFWFAYLNVRCSKKFQHVKTQGTCGP
jgi:hypothetical protein